MSPYGIIIRNGLIYDGSGQPAYQGDLAIEGNTIAHIGNLGSAEGLVEIDARGLAVAPGFVNMMCWGVESLIEDGCSQSEIRQGVTLEVMGEGSSMGPLSQAMKDDWQGVILGDSDSKYEVTWTTLSEYLEHLETRGVSPNVTSFVGAATVRVHVIGYDDRPATSEEIGEMKGLIRQAMAEGAIGLSTALIYPPGSYASTEEIIELAQVAAEYDGIYISHIRGEGATIIEALDEFFRITKEAGVRSEIYHLKVAGKSNWHKIDDVIRRIEDAQVAGLEVIADMYTYPYSGTGLGSCIPPWAHDGGMAALLARLKNPEICERIKAEMQQPSTEWENMFIENGPDGILLSGFKKEHMKQLTGMTLAEVAEMRGIPPEDTLIELLIEAESRIFTMYSSMSEENVRRQMQLPWVAFCSDAESQAPEGVFLKFSPHPRAYGSFARVLGKYVRDEKLLTLEEAVRRLAALPAAHLKLEKRGELKPGYFADVVVFDPESVQDHATPQNPHQYSTGMKHVFVNGVQVLKDGDHTGAKPGRVVRGPGWQGRH